MSLDSAGCLGKIGYATRAEAAHVHRKLLAKRSVRGRMTPYHCGRCGLFHLGREPTVEKSERNSRENVERITRWSALVRR
jgi:hypothetical protein